jgi:hypothetical protein
MHQSFCKLLMGVLLLCASLNGYSQDSLQKFKTEGFWTGYGLQLNPGIKYQVYYIAGEFSFPFNKRPKKNFLSWYLEPQFNLVNTGSNDFEFGMNIGLKNTVRINSNLIWYQFLGSGPHMISAKLKRQATGYIFSDNIGVGLLKRIHANKPLFFNLQLRYRHISNASLKRPNSGIDNVNIIVGISGIGN